MSVLTLQVDEVMRTLSNDGQYPFVVNDKTVDIVRFALNTGFTDVVFDENTALRVMYQRPGETEVRAQTLTYYDTDGLRSYYDWHLLPSDLAEKGTLTVALCILRTDGDVEEWHTTPCQIRVLDTIHTDDSDEADETITPTVAQRVAVLETMIQRVASGAPIVVASTSAMTDTAQIYVLSTDGMWYYYDGSAWAAGGEYGAVATDTTLTQSGAPADAKVVGDEIADLKSDLSETENEIIRTAGVVEELECGLTEEVKAALLACFAHVAWISDDGQTYCDALSNALNRSRVLSSIRAVFTQGSAVIYDTDELYSLKQYLTVTATYSDATTKEVNNYTLDGILTAGTSTITVSYGKKTATFNVTVTHQQKTIESITATLSSSAAMTTDNVLDDLRPYLTVRATYSDGSTQTVSNYTLNGSLNVGVNTITVTYSGKTATFTVNVTEAEAALQSITATFIQGSAVIYTNSLLDDLKPYLTITARYSNGTTQTVTNYTLSGTLTKGTSTITASYSGKTATFNVTVSERSATLQSITATFNQGSAVIYTDSSLDDLKPYLTVTATYSDSTTQTVTGYTLSGTLTAGTSTITASYGGKTATFNVNVTASSSDKELSYITADFAPGTNKIYESKGLDQLRQYLTVVAHYSDSTVATVTNYALAGDLIGNQLVTIRVTYTEGNITKPASFSVTAETIMYDWDFTESMYDKVANAYATPSAGENYGAPSRTSNGVEFIVSTQMLTLIDGNDNINHLDMTVEIDVASFSFKGDNTKHVRFFMDQRGDDSNSVGTGPLIFRSSYGWTSYGYKDAEHTEAGYRKWSDTGWGSLYNTDQINALNGKTVKIYYGADGHTRKLYLDGTLVGTMTDVYFYKPTLRLRLGGGTSYSASSGDQCYDMTISGVRIYRGEV